MEFGNDRRRAAVTVEERWPSADGHHSEGRHLPASRERRGEVIAGKGFTNYAVSLATARIIESVLYDEHQVLPVSSLIDDFIGIKDMCLSVPSVVNRNGVQRTLPVCSRLTKPRPCRAQRRRPELSFSDAACEDYFGSG